MIHETRNKWAQVQGNFRGTFYMYTNYVLTCLVPAKMLNFLDVLLFWHKNKIVSIGFALCIQFFKLKLYRYKRYRPNTNVP